MTWSDHWWLRVLLLSLPVVCTLLLTIFSVLTHCVRKSHYSRLTILSPCCEISDTDVPFVTILFILYGRVPVWYTYILMKWLYSWSIFVILMHSTCWLSDSIHCRTLSILGSGSLMVGKYSIRYLEMQYTLFLHYILTYWLWHSLEMTILTTLTWYWYIVVFWWYSLYSSFPVDIRWCHSYFCSHCSSYYYLATEKSITIVIYSSTIFVLVWFSWI